MKTQLFSLLLICMLAMGCKKDSGSSSNTWHVKYEVTSTNTNAKGAFVFRDESGSVKNIGLGVPSLPLPWTYEADWSKDAGLVAARSLSIAVSVSPSNSSDVTTIKIYVDGKVANQTTTGMLTYILVP